MTTFGRKPLATLRRSVLRRPYERGGPSIVKVSQIEDMAPSL